MTAVISFRSLAQKLGVKPHSVFVILNQPEDYGHLLFPIPEGCSIYDQLSEQADTIQFFTKEKKELETMFPKLKEKLQMNGSLWISWPKGTSTFTSNLNENRIREIGLQNGLVDVKVIAINEDWSGLKFVYRVTDRK